jgi:glycosyltransferase involved in cell wall biosynthesis
MKKKLVIFMPSIEGGGVEKNLFIVANYLTKKINNIALITISKKYKSKFDKSIDFISLESEIWDKQSRKFKYFLSLYLLLKEILKNRNLLIFAFQANIYCIILCKIFNIKIIVRSNSAPIGWSQNLIKKFFFKYFLNKADKVMVNSVEFKKSIKKRFNVNAICIYNPLNKFEILKKSKVKSKKYFLTNKKIKILNIGRYVDQKDQETLIRALNEIKKKVNFEAIIVGKGILKKKMLTLINKFKLNKMIKLKNFMENPFPILKQSELFILTSKFEGLPNVLLESIVLKKSIISSDCETGPREILDDGKGGTLFRTNDYKDLAKKIFLFSKNKKKYKKKNKIAYERLKRFDYNYNLNKYLKLVSKELNF